MLRLFVQNSSACQLSTLNSWHWIQQSRQHTVREQRSSTSIHTLMC